MHFASARIITADVDAAVAFYSRLLEAEAERPAPVFAAFRAPTGTLAIGDVRTVPVDGFARSHGGVIIEFEVADPSAVDAAHERLRHDVPVVQAPTDMPWGNRSLLVRDPDGNLVNVYAPLPR